MKSNPEQLWKRGVPGNRDWENAKTLSLTDLSLLDHSEAASRTAAIQRLGTLEWNQPLIVQQLLKLLVSEKALYTRLAIADLLVKGDRATAKEMTHFLGGVGQNQYRSLPNKVSKKTSFPLPRDFIARSLGKMDQSVMPDLMAILETDDGIKIREVLDGIGFLVFYHQELATKEAVEKVISLCQTFKNDQIIHWKVILCLSAFPIEESKAYLLDCLDYQDVRSLEADRSLRLIREKNNRLID